MRSLGAALPQHLYDYTQRTLSPVNLYPEMHWAVLGHVSSADDLLGQLLPVLLTASNIDSNACYPFCKEIV